MPELPLAGGMANAGRVVRVGDTVRRPVGPHSPAVRALLEHLARVGFDGAPRHLGLDDAGREVLTYVDGDVGLPTSLGSYPAWVRDEALLDSVARLQRRYHAAVSSFSPPPNAVWDLTLASPGVEPIVGHNDLCVENVVCRDGRAVALIDFDFAAPTDRLWDVAIALRHWVPVRHPDDLAPVDDGTPRRAGLDQVARYRRYCDVYAVAAADRPRLVALGLAFLRQALDRMGGRARAGQPAYVAAWAAGYPQQNERAQSWLADNAGLLAGLTAG